MTTESGGSSFDLPEEVVQVLPSDPFEQLDVARKITSIALSTRVSAIESESSALRANIAEKDKVIAELQSQVESLDASLSDTADKLVRAEQDKENMLKENASLSNAVRKLNRDVSKLEVFRRTLMQSLKEDDDNSGGAPDIVAKIQNQSSLTSTSQFGDNDASSQPSISSSTSHISDSGNSFTEDQDSDAIRPRVPYGLLIASQNSTPRITPPGSPRSLSASVSPTRISRLMSPRRHSISFSTSRGMHDDRSSVFSSMSFGHGSISSSDTGTGSQTGRTRVDGKEFFRQVRNRLSYEQFGAFLANVKELNSHKQTREAKAELKRSAVADSLSGESTLSEVRTSSGMFISKNKDPIIAGIEDKISSWTFLPKENGEDIQVLRYEHGQKYDPHYDYFTDQVNIAQGGHRFATVLMYLTNVTRGGETVFPVAEEPPRRRGSETSSDLSECAKKGIAVKPRRGDALLFFSLHTNATPDTSSLHAGCPVIEGEKWSATKWIHVDSFDKMVGAEGGCSDQHESCERWASLGECTSNPVYMVGSSDLPGYCRKSCKAC